MLGFSPGWWWAILNPLALIAQALLGLLMFGRDSTKIYLLQCGKGFRFLGSFVFLVFVKGCFPHCPIVGSSMQVPPAVKDWTRLKENGSFQDRGGHWDSFWEVIPPPFFLTTYYLVTKASQSLLSSLWWMVLGVPQWPEWLACADKTLNDFCEDIIAPQTPKDTVFCCFPPVAEIETESVSPFPPSWPMTL